MKEEIRETELKLYKKSTIIVSILAILIDVKVYLRLDDIPHICCQVEIALITVIIELLIIYVLFSKEAAISKQLKTTLIGIWLFMITIITIVTVWLPALDLEFITPSTNEVVIFQIETVWMLILWLGKVFTIIVAYIWSSLGWDIFSTDEKGIAEEKQIES